MAKSKKAKAKKGKITKAPAPENNNKAKKKKIPAFISGLPDNSKIKEVFIKDIDQENTNYQARLAIGVGDLIKIIRQQGQKVPVMLKGQKPKYQIIDGFRRVKAIEKIGWEKVNAIIYPRISEEDAYNKAILANIYRKTFNDLDRANAIVKYKKMGKQVKDIADIFHVSTRRIEDLQNLLSLDPILSRALSSSKNVTTAHALVLQKAKGLHKGLDLKAWIKEVKGKELSYRDLRKALKEKYGKKTEVHKPINLFKEIKGEGDDISIRFWPVKLDPKTMTPDDAREIKAKLERALEIVGKVAG